MLLKGEMKDTLSLSLDKTVGFYAIAIIAITVYSSMKTLQSTSISLSYNLQLLSAWIGSSELRGLILFAFDAVPPMDSLLFEAIGICSSRLML